MKPNKIKIPLPTKGQNHLDSFNVDDIVKNEQQELNDSLKTSSNRRIYLRVDSYVDRTKIIEGAANSGYPCRVVQEKNGVRDIIYYVVIDLLDCHGRTY